MRKLKQSKHETSKKKEGDHRSLKQRLFGKLHSKKKDKKEIQNGSALPLPALDDESGLYDNVSRSREVPGGVTIFPNEYVNEESSEYAYVNPKGTLLISTPQYQEGSTYANDLSYLTNQSAVKNDSSNSATWPQSNESKVVSTRKVSSETAVQEYQNVTPVRETTPQPQGLDRKLFKQMLENRLKITKTKTTSEKWTLIPQSIGTKSDSRDGDSKTDIVQNKTDQIGHLEVKDDEGSGNRSEKSEGKEEDDSEEPGESEEDNEDYDTTEEESSEYHSSVDSVNSESKEETEEESEGSGDSSVEENGSEESDGGDTSEEEVESNEDDSSNDSNDISENFESDEEESGEEETETESSDDEEEEEEEEEENTESTVSDESHDDE